LPPYRIAHVITRLVRGGAQENTLHTVRLASRGRFEAELVTGLETGPEGSLMPEAEALGCPIHRIPSLTRNPHPLRDARALHELTRLFRQQRYDIVHTHTSKAGILARKAAQRAGVPIIIHTPHGHIFHSYFNVPVTRFFVALERRAAPYTDRIVTLTDGEIEEHLERGIGHRTQYRTVFSGIDFGPFEAAAAQREAIRIELGLPAGAILVGGVGRLEPVKGFTYLIQAAHIVAESIPNIHFVIAGDGSLRAALEAEARPLAGRFHFLGLRGDIPDIMAALDLFVLPSLNEGMGRVLLEAAAAGKVAVASAVGGVPEIVVNGETGLLVPPKDPEALAAAIAKLANDAGLRQRMGQAARNRVVPAFGVMRMVELLEQLYDECIREKRLDA
jgi:glycosyltransferase involved in cell wall biosynthesis